MDNNISYNIIFSDILIKVYVYNNMQIKYNKNLSA